MKTFRVESALPYSFAFAAPWKDVNGQNQTELIAEGDYLALDTTQGSEEVYCLLSLSRTMDVVCTASSIGYAATSFMVVICTASSMAVLPYFSTECQSKAAFTVDTSPPFFLLLSIMFAPHGDCSSYELN